MSSSHSVTVLSLLFLAMFFSASLLSAQQNSYEVQSPDKRTTARIATGDSLTITIMHDGKTILFPSPLSLEIAGSKTLGLSSIVADAKTSEVSETITPVVAEKRSSIPDHYRLLTLRFSGGWSLLVRAYNDGIAYRFHTDFPGEISISNERLAVHLGAQDSIWFPEEESFLSHSERLYSHVAVKSLADSQMCCLPAVIETAQGPRLAVTEADLLDYPGLYLKGAGTGQAVLNSLLPGYPSEEEFTNDRTAEVTQRAPYIARTRGTRDFPWRVFAIADRDCDLIANDIVYRLGSPTSLKETSWIRPGKVAWDWWNANNVYGVPFKSGVNTATYKYYIDFASVNKIEYVIFDEGWSKPSDLFMINPAMDMEALFAYAKQKNVGIILWVIWNALENRMTEALDRFVAWGAKGIKVDFMQRDDQKMVNFYERTAQEAAKRHLLVDFHGSYKPTGFSRTYPNALTREGVRGLEWSKWSKDVTPRHDVTIPFTRMFAGAMDFTPGALRNTAQGNFQAIFSEPMSQGTRCHQLAMYVIYESPLQMLCDNPSDYMREPQVMEYLSTVPTTWDETRPIDGKIGEYLVVARRKGTTWYIGAMTDWTPRNLTIDLSFIGNAVVNAYEDGPNAEKRGRDYVRQELQMKNGEPLTIHLAPGGGWVGIVRPAGASQSK